jgi:hypothetical protein
LGYGLAGNPEPTLSLPDKVDPTIYHFSGPVQGRSVAYREATQRAHPAGCGRVGHLLVASGAARDLGGTTATGEMPLAGNGATVV